MAWMYLVEGAAGAKPIGPLADKEIVSLIRTGKIKRKTAIAHPKHTGGQWVESGTVKATSAIHDQLEAAIEKAKGEARAARKKLIDESRTRLFSYRPSKQTLLAAVCVFSGVLLVSYVGTNLLLNGDLETSMEFSDSVRRANEWIFFIAILAVIAAVHGVIGSWIGSKLRGDPVNGAILGAILGVFGWPLILVLADRRRRCGKCYSVVHSLASVCRHCREPLDSGSLTAPHATSAIPPVIKSS